MYAFTQDVPIDREVYTRIRDGLGEVPDGLVVHIAAQNPDGTIRYVDVWSDREAAERFTRDRLHPVVGASLAAAGINPGGEPPRVPLDVVDVWGPVLTVV